MRRCPLAFAAIAALTISLWATSVRADVRATWERAELWLNFGEFAGGHRNGHLTDPEMQAALSRLPEGTRFPTVLYIHGCTYVKSAGWGYARTLKNAGYAVIMPDSFARPGRGRSCQPFTRKPERGVFVDHFYDLRLEEIRFAVERARDLPWVDPDNLFLMGHGEGGVAVAAYEGESFRGRIVSAAPCPLGLGDPTTPVLVVTAEEDPLFGKDPARSCVERGGDRPAPLEVVTIPGRWLDLSGDRGIRRAILDFLERHSRRGP